MARLPRKMFQARATAQTTKGNPMRTPKMYCSEKVRAAFSLVELIIVIAIIGILAALMMPALARGKSKARNTVCDNNLHQMGIAVRLDAEDNANHLPSAELLPTEPINPQQPLPRICDVLAAYIGKAGSTNADAATVFRCPCDDENYFPTEGASYEWNAGLNGKLMDQTESKEMFMVTRTPGGPEISTNFTLQFPPETTPLLLDYEDFHPRPPQSGKNVVYMDGHVS